MCEFLSSAENKKKIYIYVETTMMLLYVLFSWQGISMWLLRFSEPLFNMLLINLEGKNRGIKGQSNPVKIRLTKAVNPWKRSLHDPWGPAQMTSDQKMRHRIGNDSNLCWISNGKLKGQRWMTVCVPFWPSMSNTIFIGHIFRISTVIWHFFINKNNIENIDIHYSIKTIYWAIEV